MRHHGMCQQDLNNNNNEISPVYIIDTFHLYYWQAKKLSGSCGKMHVAHKSSQAIQDSINMQYYRIRQRALNNNHNKILMAYMLGAFHVYHQQAGKLLANCGGYEWSSSQVQLADFQDLVIWRSDLGKNFDYRHMAFYISSLS